MSARLLALDFDGVVADSAPEAFLVALRSFASLWPRSELAQHARHLDQCPTRETLRNSPIYGPFVGCMPLGNRAEDFGVVLAALEVGFELVDQAAYDLFRSRYDEAWLSSFHRCFYTEREKLASRDSEAWLALMAPFAPLLGLLRGRAGDATLAIATARDRRSVQQLLSAYGVADLVADELLIDKEAGRSKRAHLRMLAKRSGIPARDTRFIDDKVNHLEIVSELGVGCALAAWGYNGSREQLLARERGFQVCSLADVERWAFG